MQNKKKLALALAILPSLPLAAHADVTVYGFLSGGVESTKATGNGDTAKDYRSTTRVLDNNSRIGFKGNEDLGNGLKVIWQVESSLRNFENGGSNDKGETATLATRNTFVGLQGGFGTFLVGNYDTAYKRLPGSVGLNILGDTAGDTHGGVGIHSRRETRLKNSVSYTSPVFSGIQAGVSYGVDEARTVGSVDGYRQNDDRLSVAASYANGGLKLGAGYDREGSRLNSASAPNQKAINKTEGYKLAAGYKFATGTFVGAGFEQVKVDNASAADTTQNDWLAALGQEFGAVTVKAGYGRLGKLKNAAAGTENDYKAKQWLLGATYDLSKRTQLYAYATKIKNESRASVNFVTNSVYSEGGGTSAAKLTAGNDPQAFGIGMKVSF
ncbi:porin [Crenobacter cavernae]|uniref:Porin n=1 Tax=Crenobacter cavernae TaxID=2290923 RepID=A0ABY0FB62_9NEIS|nr:porin [Crenobacter cavernae]RXZ43203.1 porin [Crenobacter cavernae]